MRAEYEFIGFFTLLHKEIARFMRVVGQTVISPLVSSGLYLLVFGVSLSELLKEHQGVSYLAFLVPGLVAMAALNNSLQNSSSSVMISKFHGDLQDLRVIPLSAFSIGSAYVLACIIRGVLVGALVFAMGEVFSYVKTHEWISVAHPGYLTLFLFLGCSIFGNLGIWIGFAAQTFDQVNAFTTFVVLPLTYLGGVFFSLEILHPFWKTVALANPLLYAIDAIRWTVLGQSDINPLKSFAVLCFFVVLTSFLAWRSVKYGSYARF